MNTVLTMLAIALRVDDIWCHGFSKFAMTTCFFTYTCELFECFCETQRYTASRDDRVNRHIECTIFFVFVLRCRLVAVLTLLISQPPMASTIFRHFRHNKKHLVSTPFTLSYYTPSPKNAESHENRRSNPRAYTPIKTHIYSKSPFPTKPMQIFILQNRDQIHQNIPLPVQQKHDTQPLQDPLTVRIVSSHQRPILCSYHPPKTLNKK